MNSSDNDADNQHRELKPELSFEWVKYKKVTPEKKLDTIVSNIQRQEQKKTILHGQSAHERKCASRECQSV